MPNGPKTVVVARHVLSLATDGQENALCVYRGDEGKEDLQNKLNAGNPPPTPTQHSEQQEQLPTRCAASVGHVVSNASTRK